MLNENFYSVDDIINMAGEGIESEDRISVEQIRLRTERIVSAYNKLWNSGKVDLENNHEDITGHISILRNLKQLFDFLNTADEYGEVISESEIHDYVEEKLNDEYSDLMEMVEYRNYEWPYSHIEFDKDAAISEIVDSAETVDILGHTFYHNIEIG